MTSPMSATGFYAPVKDAVQGYRKRRARRVRLAPPEGQQMGETTWILVSAHCGRAASASPVVRSCRVERYQKAFDSCVEAEPVPERAVRFTPSGQTKIEPGGTPQRWEARFLTEYLRRAARKGEDDATAREMGPEVLSVKYQWEDVEARRRSSTRLLPRLLAALEGPPRVRLRVVLDVVGQKPVTSDPFDVPPVEPTRRRVFAALRPTRV